MSRYIWNKEKGCDGHLDTLWEEVKLIDDGGHSYTFKRMVGYTNTDWAGVRMNGEIEKSYLEQLITEEYLIKHNTGEPIKSIGRLKITQ